MLMKCLFAAAAVLAGLQVACGGELKTRVLQPPYAAGLRCNVFWSDDPAEAKRFLEMGVDTILTNDYLPISEATGLK